MIFLKRYAITKNSGGGVPETFVKAQVNIQMRISPHLHNSIDCSSLTVRVDKRMKYRVLVMFC